MIGYLQGTIKHVAQNWLVLVPDGSGIGYRLALSPTRLLTLSPGEQVNFFTYYYVKDDIHALYGFTTVQELELFEKLIGVSGIGPKGAIHILSLGSVATIAQAIIRGDDSFVSQADGIGKRTAAKVILELKEKVSAFATTSDNEVSDDSAQASPSPAAPSSSEELITALTSLGFSKGSVRHILGKLDHTLPLESQIRQALKLLG